MILYLDTSALVKCYVQEPGSNEVIQWIAQARVVATCALTQVKVVAALARATRTRSLSAKEAASAIKAFRSEWESFVRIDLTEVLLSRAAEIAWQQQLRAYDAVHLAAALFWQEILGEPICMATYDRELWNVARRASLELLPKEKP